MTAKVDRMLRGFDPATYARLKRAAQARGITMAEYVSRLVRLHDAVLEDGNAEVLAEFGLGRVTD